MANGASTTGLIKLAMMLAGAITIWRGNRAKRRGDARPEDDEAAQHKAARAETERRMASYLAQRGSAYKGTDHEMSEQEIRR